MSKSIPMRWLKHPLTVGMDVDDPKTTLIRRSIIQNKRYLRKIYEEWYVLIQSSLPDTPRGPVVELGSGAGFMKEFIPELITTEVLPIPGIDVQLQSDGCLPFESGSVRAIVMTDVLHHISDPRRFFKEATRTIMPGGAIVMIEPWMSPWSRIIYSRFHPEPFDPNMRFWEFPSEGALSSANGALPWMIFSRDRYLFEREFPQWNIDQIQPMMPVSYLLSGGVSMRSLCPGIAFPAVRYFEKLLMRFGINAAMFALIKLTKDKKPLSCDKIDPS